MNNPKNKRKKTQKASQQEVKTENIPIKNFVMQIRIKITEKKRKKAAKKAKKQECLKCKYQKLMEQGKVIFDNWDQKGKPPKKLIEIQKQLLKLKKAIKQQKIDEELEYCAEHPEIFEFLPSEWA